MRKLPSKVINEILIDFYQNKISPLVIANEKHIHFTTVYHHIKQNDFFFVGKPTCYNDYLKINIMTIQRKIDENFYTPEQLKHAQQELKRLKYWFRKDKKNMPSDAFILQ